MRSKDVGAGAKAGGTVEGGVQGLTTGAGEDDVEVAAAGTVEDEELAGGLEGGQEAAGLADAEAGFGGEGVLGGEGKAIFVGKVGQGQEEEQSVALLVGIGPDTAGAMDAHRREIGDWVFIGRCPTLCLARPAPGP